jgi:CubicO group peptidase (beta-lactamase class C family)
MLEQIYHAPLAKIAQEKVFDPLEMHATTFSPSNLTDDMVAPTELDGGQPVHKIVHDEGARALGGIGKTAGSAGLFSTAPDLLNFCDMLLARGLYKGKQLLTPATIEAFQTNQLAIPGERAALGWELDRPNFMGSHATPHTFGKTGFTGCFVMVDIPRQIAMVLLSNAQYPTRHTDRSLVNSLRARLADVIFRPEI